jgi:hypothetical protein
VEWEDALEGWKAELANAGWVTLAEAEAATGVSRSALRSWYRTGGLLSRVEEGPHGPQRLVELEAVLDRVARSPRLARRTTVTASPTNEEALHRLIDLLAAQIERAEARAERAEAALFDLLRRTYES